MFSFYVNKLNNDLVEIDLPSSKSISNRAIILNALLNNQIELKNLSEADDTQLMLAALENTKNKEVNLHNAGTCMRFLTAFFAARPGKNIRLLCSSRMEERPISDLVSALTELGAQILYLKNQKFPPLEIVGQKLKGKSLYVDATKSSQFITALLLVSPFIQDGLTIHFDQNIASLSYIKMTVLLMQRMGFEVDFSDEKISILPYQNTLSIKEYNVEKDWSGAAFWYLISILMPNKPILLKNLFLNSIQGDEAMVNFFEKLGTETSQLTNGVLLRNNKNSLNELTFNLQNCLDLAPALCVSCAVLNVKAHITGLQNLVIKESNRLLAICNELNKLGFKLSYSADSIVVNPSYDIDYEASVTINSYQDHRIIMAFAPLALLFKNICMDEISSVSKSYPSFFNDLKLVGIQIQDSKKSN